MMKSFSFFPFVFNPHINDDFSEKKGIFFQRWVREENVREMERSWERVQLVKQEIQSKFNSHTHILSSTVKEKFEKFLILIKGDV